jgi:hypothetical protein
MHEHVKVDVCGIIGFIEKQTLNWLGHVKHMTEDNILQKIKRWKPMSKHQIGRHKMRWEDNVLEDVRSMDLCNWKNVAQNRESWKNLIQVIAVKKKRRRRKKKK